MALRDDRVVLNLSCGQIIGSVEVLDPVPLCLVHVQREPHIHRLASVDHDSAVMEAVNIAMALVVDASATFSLHDGTSVKLLDPLVEAVSVGLISALRSFIADLLAYSIVLLFPHLLLFLPLLNHLCLVLLPCSGIINTFRYIEDHLAVDTLNVGQAVALVALVVLESELDGVLAAICGSPCDD